MKKSVLIFFLQLLTLAAQENSLSKSFSNFRLEILGGINFETTAHIGPLFLLEAKNNLYKQFDLKLSIGYTRAYDNISYHVDTYNFKEIQEVKFYQESSYDVINKGYDILPFSIGIIYNYPIKSVKLYVITDLSFNEISTNIFTSQVHDKDIYETIEQIPDQYKPKHSEKFVNNSLSYCFGFGFLMPISQKLNIDIRYSYSLNHELINTNIFLIGIEF